MNTLITITSKRQATFPKKLLDNLGVKKGDKLLAKIEKNKVTLEPVPDIMQLSGIFQNKAIKSKSMDEIIRLEEDVVARAIAEDYRKKFLKKE